MTTFADLLKKKCLKCTKGSLKTYLQNVRRLYKLEFEGPVPTTATWLGSEALFKKYKKIPVNIRRHLSLGAIKALQSYGKETAKNKWYKAMIDDQNDYVAQRAKHEKTDTEKEKWTSTKALKKAARDLKRRYRHVLESKPTLANLYRIQWWLVIKLFTTIRVTILRPYG